MKPAFLMPGVFLVLAGLPPSHAQTASAKNTVRFPRYTQAAGTLDRDGFPTSGATITLRGHPGGVFRMPSQTVGSGAGKTTYDFGLDPRSERLPLSAGGSWVFFAATFSAGGSGTLERLAVLRYEQGAKGKKGGGKIVNLLPFVGATELSERAMWTIPGASACPVLVVANFVWGTANRILIPTSTPWKPGAATLPKTAMCGRFPTGPRGNTAVKGTISAPPMSSPPSARPFCGGFGQNKALVCMAANEGEDLVFMPPVGFEPTTP